MKRRTFLKHSLASSALAPLAGRLPKAGNHGGKKYNVAAFYFPNYHVDPRNELIHGKGWTEWEPVKRAAPRFDGHQQPKVPLWGYEDEADPVVMAKKIDVASKHGLTHFIFDWYHYDDGPFLQRCLDEGYLKAENNSDLGFALMWANHNWRDRIPTSISDRRLGQRLLYRGAVSPQTFEKITDLVTEKYFLHPSYWLLDNRPYFSIYDLYAFLESFGGTERAVEALKNFDEKVRHAGFKGLFLNVMYFTLDPAIKKFGGGNVRDVLKALDCRCTARYLWNPTAPENMPFPHADYLLSVDKYSALWGEDLKKFGVPVWPSVAMGWDSSPRTVQSDMYEDIGYPFGRINSNNTPAHFERALQRAKDFLDRHPESQRTVLINAWNEWTEGSYLEPDTATGLAYLEAVKSVFKNQ